MKNRISIPDTDLAFPPPSDLARSMRDSPGTEQMRTGSSTHFWIWAAALLIQRMSILTG